MVYSYFCDVLDLFLESPNIEDFGVAVGMSKQEVENLKLILFSVEQGDVGILHSLGIKVRQIKHHLQRSWDIRSK